MSTTKYIVNNVSGQTISEINSTTINTDTISATNYLNLPIPNLISSGPSAPGSAVVANPTKIDINFSDGIGTAWSFSPTGMTFPDDTVQSTAYVPPYKVYTALLAQNGGSSILIANGETLTIGVTYTIINTDNNTVDFTNVGAPNNSFGTYFVATGTTPTSWGIDTLGELQYNTGVPIVTVIENTIGNIWFNYSDNGSYYINSNALFSTVEKCYINISSSMNYTDDAIFVGIRAVYENDSQLRIDTFNIENGGAFIKINGNLNYTPIEIRVYN